MVDFMVKRLNPKNFTNFNLQDSDIGDKIFLYEEREPNSDEFEFEDLKFSLDDPVSIDLSGQVTDPSKTIARSLFNSYEWSHLKASFADGWLFIYIEFAPGSDSDSKQLKFKVYPLKKK